jgi:nucleoside-diphosphate-sugar epimerase
MRIAIAGTGDVSKYLVEEFLKASYDVVVLSRGHRDWFVRPDISLRITDYSVGSLISTLEDCDGIIAATQDGTMTNVDLHLSVLEACTQTKSCKRFIPSEYIGNVEEFPNQPAFYVANHQPIREALARQDDVEWTLVNPGWLADYVVPSKYRYIRDIGECHPVDFTNNTMVIPGTGDEPITCTAVRDMAAAIAALFASPRGWPRVTYLSGQATSWNEVKMLLQEDGHKFDVIYRSVASLEAVVAESTSEDDVLVAEFGLWSTSGATRVPEAKAADQRKQLFSKLHFRNLRDLLGAARTWSVAAI